MKETYTITLTQEELRLISWSVLSEGIACLDQEGKVKRMALHERLYRILFGMGGESVD